MRGWNELARGGNYSTYDAPDDSEFRLIVLDFEHIWSKPSIQSRLHIGALSFNK